MSEEERTTQDKATEETLQRGLTGDIATVFAEAVATGAGVTTGKVVVDKIVGHVTAPKDEPPKIILPPGSSSE